MSILWPFFYALISTISFMLYNILHFYTSLKQISHKICIDFYLLFTFLCEFWGQHVKFCVKFCCYSKTLKINLEKTYKSFIYFISISLAIVYIYIYSRILQNLKWSLTQWIHHINMYMDSSILPLFSGIMSRLYTHL